ncbi:hypothetical protein HPB50_019019 [Hyalomma asiaticum]|uniref:Uncharacterized protein n=1 Tax=Hyalomma asiaticum TaxID=266040 RepID=A0ACB7T5C7_HYAAI|nr:hypothetical protein HPB50_019019 [Hyalomma asiaticum]
MVRTNVHIAVACDPYRPKGRTPKLPEGFSYVGCGDDAAALVTLRRPAFDVCPVLVSKQVRFGFGAGVSIRPVAQANGTQSRVKRGDCGSLHLSERRGGRLPRQAPSLGPERGARVMELAATTGLAVLNDPLSPPTYETAYAASWLDVTTRAVVAAGCAWEVQENVTFSEHRFTAVKVGNREAAPRKSLTRYAQMELLQALSQELRFGRMVRSQPGTPEVLKSLIGGFTGTLKDNGGPSNPATRATLDGRRRWLGRGGG